MIGPLPGGQRGTGVGAALPPTGSSSSAPIPASISRRAQSVRTSTKSFAARSATRAMRPSQPLSRQECQRGLDRHVPELCRRKRARSKGVLRSLRRLDGVRTATFSLRSLSVVPSLARAPQSTSVHRRRRLLQRESSLLHAADPHTRAAYGLELDGETYTLPAQWRLASPPPAGLGAPLCTRLSA